MARLCDVDECGRVHRAKGLCAYHYRIENPPKKATPVECPTCGTLTMKRDKERRFCSLLCRDVWRIETGNNPQPPRKVANRSTLPPTHPVRRLIQANAQKPSVLRHAYEAGDWPAVLSEIELRCVKVDTCWLWPRAAKDGYGRIVIAGRSFGAHRLAAMAALGETIPSHMPVHHACSEPLCVNPDHLQVITPHENTAEMLERRYYQKRIADLEASLARIAPNHPLLMPDAA